MLKISYAGCLGLSPAISAHFTLEMCVEAQNREKKSLKSPILGVQGHSRSSMLTFLKSSLPVFVMISSMYVPICNHFHVGGANNGRMTPFKGVPLPCPLVRGDPLHPGAWNFVGNTRDSKLSYGKNQKFLSHLVLERYRDVTDRRTDRQNYRSYNTRYIALARNNWPANCTSINRKDS